jgi:hypothetical protein
MVQDHDELGTTQALLERLVHWRLPRMLELKQRVDAGERLTDPDLEFLKDVLEDAQSGQQFIVRHPELHELAGRLVLLYEDIVKKAVENESKAG